MVRRFRMGLSCACLFGLSLVPVFSRPPITGAASDVLPIDVYICDHNPTSRFGGASIQPVPEGCAPEAGVAVTVWSADGDRVGSCETGGNGGCGAPSLFDAVVVVAEETATIPKGYRPRANPGVSWQYTEFRGATFVNIPADVPINAPAEDEAATLTIHSRFCPPGFAGPDFYTACNPTPPPYRQAFNLHGPSPRAGWAENDGNLTFDNLAPGDYAFVAGIPEATTDVFVYCSLTDDPNVRVPASIHLSPFAPSNDYDLELTLDPGADVLCDFYPIPLADGAPPPARNGEEFPVLVLTCDQDPGQLGAPSLIPRGCAPVTGASLVAQRFNSTVSDECATAEGGWCDLTAFSGEPVVVTLDPSVLLPGYLPMRDPVAADVVRGFAGLTIVALPHPEASGAATLTIHARVCPPRYDGTDRFDDCPETLPDTLFTVSGPDTTSDRPTGGDGNIVFDDLTPGDYAVWGGLRGEPVAYDVVCIDAGDPSVAFPFDRLNERPDAPLSLELADGDDVVCDWYSTSP